MNFKTPNFDITDTRYDRITGVLTLDISFAINKPIKYIKINLKAVEPDLVFCENNFYYFIDKFLRKSFPKNKQNLPLCDILTEAQKRFIYNITNNKDNNIIHMKEARREGKTTILLMYALFKLMTNKKDNPNNICFIIPTCFCRRNVMKQLYNMVIENKLDHIHDFSLDSKKSNDILFFTRGIDLIGRSYNTIITDEIDVNDYDISSWISSKQKLEVINNKPLSIISY